MKFHKLDLDAVDREVREVVAERFQPMTVTRDGNSWTIGHESLDWRSVHFWKSTSRRQCLEFSAANGNLLWWVYFSILHHVYHTLNAKYLDDEGIGKYVPENVYPTLADYVWMMTEMHQDEHERKLWYLFNYRHDQKYCPEPLRCLMPDIEGPEIVFDKYGLHEVGNEKA